MRIQRYGRGVGGGGLRNHVTTIHIYFLVGQGGCGKFNLGKSEYGLCLNIFYRHTFYF